MEYSKIIPPIILLKTESESIATTLGITPEREAKLREIISIGIKEKDRLTDTMIFLRDQSENMNEFCYM